MEPTPSRIGNITPVKLGAVTGRAHRVHARAEPQSQSRDARPDPALRARPMHHSVMPSSGNFAKHCPGFGRG